MGGKFAGHRDDRQVAQGEGGQAMLESALPKALQIVASCLLLQRLLLLPASHAWPCGRRSMLESAYRV